MSICKFCRNCVKNTCHSRCLAHQCKFMTELTNDIVIHIASEIDTYPISDFTTIYHFLSTGK